MEILDRVEYEGLEVAYWFEKHRLFNTNFKNQ